MSFTSQYCKRISGGRIFGAPAHDGERQQIVSFYAMLNPSNISPCPKRSSGCRRADPACRLYIGELRGYADGEWFGLPPTRR